MKQKRKTPERDVQLTVLENLKTRGYPGLFFCSIPNGSSMSQGSRRRAVEEGMRQGAPDLFLLFKGRSIGLELKAPKGRQSDEQLQVGLEWTAAGGLYFVAYGLDQALQFLEMVGVMRPDVSKRAAA